MALTRSQVFEASERWVWFPSGAPRIETADFLLLKYPDSFEAPFQVQRINSDADASAVLDAVLDAARPMGAQEVLVWSKLSAPEGLDVELERRGAIPTETVDVLALDLTDSVPKLDGASLQIEPVVTEVALAAYAAVHDRVFNGATDVPRGEALEQVLTDKRTHWDSGLGGEMLARLNGIPVGVAGLTMAGEDARLWGAAVDRAYRGRGVYRALLEERLRFGRDHGAKTAIVKGRVGTSGPILRKAGFKAFGTETAYRIAVVPPAAASA